MTPLQLKSKQTSEGSEFHTNGAETKKEKRKALTLDEIVCIVRAIASSVGHLSMTSIWQTRYSPGHLKFDTDLGMTFVAGGTANSVQTETANTICSTVCYYYYYYNMYSHHIRCTQHIDTTYIT